MSAAPTDAELAAIRRGALFVLVGFVLSVVARVIFHGAAFSLDAGAVTGAQGMRPPDVPDPDFMLLLPLLAVLLIAKLIEAFGKIVCTSKPGPGSGARRSYVWLHLSLACDLVAVVGLVLHLFNFGRTAGPIAPWLARFDLVGLAALLPFDLFARGLSRRVSLPSLAAWARWNLIAATVLITACVRLEWWFTLMLIGHMEWRGSLAMLAVVALAVIGSYVMVLVHILGLKLADPAASGST